MIKKGQKKIKFVLFVRYVAKRNSFLALQNNEVHKYIQYGACGTPGIERLIAD